MTLRKNKVKLAEKRPLEDKENESANKKARAKIEQKAPKIASHKETKEGQQCENITIRPSTPEENFVNGDKSVPKGWKISSHKEEDGRSWVMCPQVLHKREKYQNQMTIIASISSHPSRF